MPLLLFRKEGVVGVRGHPVASSLGLPKAILREEPTKWAQLERLRRSEPWFPTKLKFFFSFL